MTRQGWIYVYSKATAKNVIIYEHDLIEYFKYALLIKNLIMGAVKTR